MKYFLIIILSACLLSCNTHYNLQFKKALKTCFSDKKDPVPDSVLRTNGFYSFTDYCSLQRADTNMIFFPDGIFLTNFFLTGPYSDSICQFFNKRLDEQPELKKYWHATYWGTYSIHKDTIVAQSFFIGSLNAGCFGSEYKYKIIDNQTLAFISSDLINTKVDKQTLEKYWHNQNRYSRARFTPLERMPSSDCKIKKKKWLWCDVNEWEAYRAKLKNKKP